MCVLVRGVCVSEHGRHYFPVAEYNAADMTLSNLKTDQRHKERLRAGAEASTWVLRLSAEGLHLRKAGGKKGGARVGRGLT